MGKSRYQRYYYATDKDIYDLLMSSKKRIRPEVMLELLREHGIFLSHEEPKERLADYVSLLPHDWPALQRLIDQAEHGRPRDKVTSVALTGISGTEAVPDAVEELRVSREKHGETYTVTREPGGGFRVVVRYSEMDYSRTRLRQRRELEAEMHIEPTAEGLRIRYPATDRAEDIVRGVVSSLQGSTEASSDERRIELSGIADPEVRTRFFTRMIRGVEGYTVHDVTIVSVDRSIATPSIESGDGEPQAKTGPVESTSDEERVEGIVKNAILRGDGVLSSEEYQALRGKLFFISKVRWHSRSQETNGPMVEFEASFGNPAEGMDFRYQVCGIWRVGSHGRLNKTRETPHPDEKRQLLALLEDAAEGALDALTTDRVESEEEGE